jgi:hypothetical protein
VKRKDKDCEGRKVRVLDGCKDSKYGDFYARRDFALYEEATEALPKFEDVCVDLSSYTGVLRRTIAKAVQMVAIDSGRVKSNITEYDPAYENIATAFYFESDDRGLVYSSGSKPTAVSSYGKVFTMLTVQEWIDYFTKIGVKK